MSIQPLPADVVAQLKSSITIANLNFVVCELLKNSLDAGAGKVNISIDQARGTCLVEDDGLGIPPTEFGETGGLGKLYREHHHLRTRAHFLIDLDSSKLNALSPTHGGRGTFLASLSALSVLTIISRHHLHRSHNMITMHKSEVVSRQTPALPQHLISYSHGTRVVVRDLFGNMPVRVKQRASLAEKQRNSNRDLLELYREIIALLLPWSGNVAVTIRESVSDQKLSIKPPSKLPLPEVDNHVHISRICSLLSQASFISPDENASWVSVGASTAKLKICGTISLEPSATKHAQFFSYGIQPLTQVDGRSILYSETNRLFFNSTFGNDKKKDEFKENERQRRANHRRFKEHGYTNKELKGTKKGVDRWPMFYINIQEAEIRGSMDLQSVLDDNRDGLENILELLRVMILQFLAKYHFRPKAGLGPHRIRAKSASPPKPQPYFTTRPLSWDTDIETNTFEANKRSRKVKPTFDQLGANIAIPPFRTSVSTSGSPFESWSRVKSGLPATSTFKTYSNCSDVHQLSSKSLTSEVSAPGTGKSSVEHPIGYSDLLVSNAGKILQCPFNDIETPQHKHHLPTPQLSQGHILETPTPRENKELISWTNPITKSVSLINRRTGLSIPANYLPPEVSSITQPFISRQGVKKTLPTGESTPWIENLLRSWYNPIFTPAEPPIPQVLFGRLHASSQNFLDSHNQCSEANIDRDYKEISAGFDGRISKDALRNAEVVSQVDKKFILVRLRVSKAEDRILVLIDQHAADERIRFESLMENLCTPSSDGVSSTTAEYSILTTLLEKPLNFEVSPTDVRLLRKHTQHFKNWGIHYQAPLRNSTTGFDTKGKLIQRLTVTSLPPTIIERCKLEPRLLIDLLRTEIYRIDSLPSTSIYLPTRHSSWLERIHKCPRGLIDMLNSRACRSAIMFNDELSNEQCAQLVLKLSKCKFPFQCAHGRPSLVPLVDMRALESMGQLLKSEEVRDFGDTFRRWKESVS
jgi:DNA mismatch repair protein MLH3